MAQITEIKRINGTVYGVKFIVCDNEEVIAHKVIGSTEGVEVGMTTKAAGAVILNAGYDYETESSFRAYNGGPRTQLVEPIYYTADEPEEDEPLRWSQTWQRGAGATDIPAEIEEEIEQIAENATQALAEEVTEIEPTHD